MSIKELNKRLDEREQEIERLNNIINELEKWLKEEIIRMKELTPKSNIMGHLELVLDKLQELKDSDKE